MTAKPAALLPHVVAGETGKPQLTIIWMHGLGADRHDFSPIVPELEHQLNDPVKFIFPHAPLRPVTLNGGMLMPAWYEIRSIGTTRDVSMDDMAESRNQIEAFIDAEQAAGMRAIQAAYENDYAPFYQLMDALAKPYEDRAAYAAYKQAPQPHEVVHQTFCGT